MRCLLSSNFSKNPSSGFPKFFYVFFRMVKPNPHRWSRTARKNDRPADMAPDQRTWSASSVTAEIEKNLHPLRVPSAPPSATAHGVCLLL